MGMATPRLQLSTGSGCSSHRDGESMNEDPRTRAGRSLCRGRRVRAALPRGTDHPTLPLPGTTGAEQRLQHKSRLLPACRLCWSYAAPPVEIKAYSSGIVLSSVSTLWTGNSWLQFRKQSIINAVVLKLWSANCSNDAGSFPNDQSYSYHKGGIYSNWTQAFSTRAGAWPST